MIYANGGTPVLKVNVKELESADMIRLMGLQSGFIRRAAQLGYTNGFSLLEDLAQQIFPETADETLSLFAEDGEAMKLIPYEARKLGPNFVNLVRAYIEAFAATCNGFQSMNRPQMFKFVSDGKSILQGDVDTLLRGQPMGVALDAGSPSLNKDLTRTSLKSLPLAQGALFYLLQPFLGFKPPAGNRLNGDYQSNEALFEMSFVMLACAEASVMHMPNIRDALWPQILRSHIDTFKGYLGMPEKEFDDVWNERRGIYAALGAQPSLEVYMKGFSWVLHETLQTGKPSPGMHGMVETMLYGETDRGVKVSLVPPFEHEFGAGGMRMLWNGRLNKHVHEFLYNADRGTLEEFLREV